MIASDIGGQTSYLNQKNGILFETGNAHELAMKIHSALKQDLSKMKHHARETALKFDKEKYFLSLVINFTTCLMKIKLIQFLFQCSNMECNNEWAIDL